MLGSLLLTLTLSAVTLVVAAGVALLRVGRHAHVAEADRSARMGRLAVASTLVGLAALATAAVLGAGALEASVTALVLGGSVLASAPAGRAWAVRGVVTWALLVVAAVGFLGWLGHRLLASPLSATEVTVAGAAWSVAALVMVPLQRHARAWIGSRAARPPPAFDETGSGPTGANRQPLVSLALLAAAVGVAATVASGDLMTPARPVEAGRSGSPEASTGTSTGSASPSSAAPDGADGLPAASSSADQGSRGSDAGDEQGSDAGRTGPTSGDAGGGASTTPAPTSTATAQPTTSPEAEPSESAKTPGYAKEKPNRPPDAPSPGGPKLP